MIQTVRIDTMTELFAMIADIPFDEGVGGFRGNEIYRGVTDADFRMTTSLMRNCGLLKKELERKILNNFAKYAEIEDPMTSGNVWRTMTLGQHHGLPTRLLDWTHSPLIALHFATAEPDPDRMETHDCAVWRISIDELHEMLPGNYKAVMRERGVKVFSAGMLDRASGGSLDAYDEAMGDRSMVIIEPPSIDQRIVNQYSFFSVVPDGINDINQFLDSRTEKTVKYVISAALRWRIRDMLDQSNVNERLIYPGLDGIARWVSRHYYVRKKELVGGYREPDAERP